jgi:hypothetical protein
MLNVMERMVAVPPKQLREQISRFVEARLAGLGISKPEPSQGAP